MKNSYSYVLWNIKTNDNESFIYVIKQRYNFEKPAFIEIFLKENKMINLFNSNYNIYKFLLNFTVLFYDINNYEIY